MSTAPRTTPAGRPSRISTTTRFRTIRTSWRPCCTSGRCAERCAPQTLDSSGRVVLLEPLLKLVHALEPAVGVGGPARVELCDLRVRQDQEPAVGDGVHHDVGDLLWHDRLGPKQFL